MPATITHSYFAKDVYDSLPINVKNKINLDRIKMFGQSSDPLMFYNLFSLKRGKNIRKLQKVFHTTKSRDYFINLINYIKQNSLYNDKDVCSYLSGFICHYVLDSNIHPFIYYKTGYFDKNDPLTYKYNNLHTFMEVFLDNYLVIKREKINPYKFDIGNFCFDMKPLSNKLNDTINYSFKKTYSINNMDYIYYKSLKQMKYSLVIFRKDRFGIKKFIYKLIDTFTPKKMFRFEAISYHYPINDKYNFLNSNHSMWRNPIKYNLTSTDSFLDLYLKSLKEARNIILDIFSYFDGNNINLNKVFINKSYVTGLDCDLNKDLKYFEF